MIEQIKAGIETTLSAIQLIKTAAQLLPDTGKQQAEQQLASAERQLQLAESQLAQALDYDLCQCTFPPQIMLYNKDKQATICPNRAPPNQSPALIGLFCALLPNQS